MGHRNAVQSVHGQRGSTESEGSLQKWPVPVMKSTKHDASPCHPLAVFTEASFKACILSVFPSPTGQHSQMEATQTEGVTTLTQSPAHGDVAASRDSADPHSVQGSARDSSAAQTAVEEDKLSFASALETPSSPSTALPFLSPSEEAPGKAADAAGGAGSKVQVVVADEQEEQLSVVQEKQEEQAQVEASALNHSNEEEQPETMAVVNVVPAVSVSAAAVEMKEEEQVAAQEAEAEASSHQVGHEVVKEEEEEEAVHGDNAVHAEAVAAAAASEAAVSETIPLLSEQGSEATAAATPAAEESAVAPSSAQPVVKSEVSAAADAAPVEQAAPSATARVEEVAAPASSAAVTVTPASATSQVKEQADVEEAEDEDEEEGDDEEEDEDSEEDAKLAASGLRKAGGPLLRTSAMKRKGHRKAGRVGLASKLPAPVAAAAAASAAPIPISSRSSSATTSSALVPRTSTGSSSAVAPTLSRASSTGAAGPDPAEVARVKTELLAVAKARADGKGMVASIKTVLAGREKAAGGAAAAAQAEKLLASSVEESEEAAGAAAGGKGPLAAIWASVSSKAAAAGRVLNFPLPLGESATDKLSSAVAVGVLAFAGYHLTKLMIKGL